MTLKPGTYVTLPPKPEYGPGRVVAVQHDGSFQVHFPRVGVKTFKTAAAFAPVDDVEAALREMHGAFRAARGLPPEMSLRPRNSGKRRITHCYLCKDPLDNAVHLECAICGWILCRCGACGCGYSR